MCGGLVNNWDVPDRNQKIYIQLQILSLFHAKVLDMHGLRGITQNAPWNFYFLSKWTWIANFPALSSSDKVFVKPGHYPCIFLDLWNLFISRMFLLRSPNSVCRFTQCWVVGADNVKCVLGNTRCDNPSNNLYFIYLKVNLSSLSHGIISFIKFWCILWLHTYQWHKTGYNICYNAMEH